MQPNNATPLSQGQRTAIIDILRGWALLGVVLMNYLDWYYLGRDWGAKTDVATNIVQGFSGIFFSGKSWTMLSFLFGYGFAVLMQNVEAKGLNNKIFFARRMFWLFILAAINSAFFFGDILKDYAVMGMVILLFHRSSAKVAFSICIGLLLVIPFVNYLVGTLGGQGGFAALTPYLPLFKSHNIFKVFQFNLIGTYLFEFVNFGYLITVHVVMLCCFFLGLAAQKINFFTRLSENKKYVKRIFWGSLAFTLFMMGLFAINSQMKLSLFKYYQPGYLMLLSSMIIIASGICWLYVAGKLKRFFRSMQVIGKMTLTNYLVQNVLAVLLFSGFGFGLYPRLHIGYHFLLALSIYIAQIYFSAWWLARYYYGPVEWIWRQLSYHKRLPIKRENITAGDTKELMPMESEGLN